MEYKDLPKQIKTPITGDLLDLQDEPEDGDSVLVLGEKSSPDDYEVHYCDDIVGVYLNEITREYWLYV